MQTDLLDYKQPKVSQNTKIIRALRAAGSYGVTSRQLINMNIFKYSSRIAELRKDGYLIVATRVKENLWRYNLVEEREEAERA